MLESFMSDNYKYSADFIKIATRYGLNPELLVAIAIDRSGFNPDFCFYDKGFFDNYLGIAKPAVKMNGYLPELNSDTYNLLTEKILRATQWGIFALHGQMARIWNYQKKLPLLLDVSESLELVCEQISINIEKNLSTEKAIRVFDNEKDAPYSKRVFELLESNKTRKYLRY